MQLFYHPNIAIGDQTLRFSKEESKHISKVLRKKTGDTLMVTDGKGNLYTSEITSLEKNQIQAKIHNIESEKPKPYQLHMAVAPTKMNDRYEWFLEKATEIGVDEITPVFCDHSERKKIKPERFNRVLQSAMKQALRYRLPVLNPATSFSEFIENEKNDQLFLAHCEKDPKRSLKTSLEPNKNCTILIGPEGDFSREEIDRATKKDFIPISLGNSRLRTETAAIVACHTVTLFNEKESE